MHQSDMHVAHFPSTLQKQFKIKNIIPGVKE